jgi:hypothetical protein
MCVLLILFEILLQTSNIFFFLVLVVLSNKGYHLKDKLGWNFLTMLLCDMFFCLFCSL